MVEEQKQSGHDKLANVRATKHFHREDADRQWLLVDAAGQRVGRLSTLIATLLRGKHKPTFTPHDDAGDFVVVINADKVVLHGNDKLNKKLYFKHSGYTGSAKRPTAAEMMEKAPHKVIELAVKGMLPRGALGHQLRRKLKVYAGGEHPHAAQKPEPVKLPGQDA